MELSVVIPVHNEEENIGSLLREIASSLEGRVDHEVIYVDDGSTDATYTRLTESREQFPRLRILRHDRTCGQSTAMLTGIRAARAPWIVTLDGDGQNDPADILPLFHMVTGTDKPPGMVVGWRRKRNDSRIRRWSSRIANGVRRRLLRDNTPDTGCGLKLFSREIYLELPYFDHMHRFLPALVQRAGNEVISVPVGHRPRSAGHSKYGIRNRLWVGVVDLFGVMWLQRRSRIPTVSGEPR